MNLASRSPDQLQVMLVHRADTGGLRIKATLGNTGSEPIRLNRVILAERKDAALAQAIFSRCQVGRPLRA